MNIMDFFTISEVNGCYNTLKFKYEDLKNIQFVKYNKQLTSEITFGIYGGKGKIVQYGDNSIFVSCACNDFNKNFSWTNITSEKDFITIMKYISYISYAHEIAYKMYELYEYLPLEGNIKNDVDEDYIFELNKPENSLEDSEIDGEDKIQVLKEKVLNKIEEIFS